MNSIDIILSIVVSILGIVSFVLHGRISKLEKNQNIDQSQFHLNGVEFTNCDKGIDNSSKIIKK